MARIGVVAAETMLAGVVGAGVACRIRERAFPQDMQSREKGKTPNASWMPCYGNDGREQKFVEKKGGEESRRARAVSSSLS